VIKTYLRILKITIISVFFVPVVSIFCSYFISGKKTPPFPIHFFLFLYLGVLGVFVLYFLSARGRRTEEFVEALSLQQSQWSNALPEKFISSAIFLSAALSLFLELAVIRWQASVFPVFAFYKNFSLLACFAGLGLGYSLASKKHLPLFLVIPLLTLQMFLFTLLHGAMGSWSLWKIKSLTAPPFPEQLNMGLDTATSLGNYVSIYFLFSVIFLMTALLFLPIGQLCGRFMQKRQKLQAYGLNLLGSFLGVGLIFLAGFFWTPPIVWFGTCFVLLLLFQPFQRSFLKISLMATLIAAVILLLPPEKNQRKYYSPYQMIVREPTVFGGEKIDAAGHFYQFIFDLSDVKRKEYEKLPIFKSIADYYDFPYFVLGRKPLSVAIVGAGTGNDVAAAVRHGAAQIDAVEIDPIIHHIGATSHPERPYQQLQVNSLINDARTFFRTGDKKYDMIIYGLLDSHAVLSHASSVRVDSFVYTVEALKEARTHLEEDGLLSLSFCVLNLWQGNKIYRIVQEAFDGAGPICLIGVYEGATTFLQNKKGNLKIEGIDFEEKGFKDITAVFSDPRIKSDVSTDDWPFLYMPRRIYPFSYLIFLGLIAVLSFVIIHQFLKIGLTSAHPAFFFLGAGFMLIEAKAITELGLVFGNTWQVVGIVISGILLMAYLANSIVFMVKNIRPLLVFVLLFISIAGGLAVSRLGGFSLTMSGKILSVAVLTLPILFAGIIFSLLLRKSKDICGAMALNLMGAMAGGLLEYNAMYFGFNFLYFLAAGFYVASFLFFYLKKE